MYIYKITCLINNKIYIGQCSKDVDKSKNYFGGGVKIKHAIKSYGKENFIKEILMQNILNQSLLNKFEEIFIKKYDSTNVEIGYNIISGSVDFIDGINPSTLPHIASKIGDKLRGIKKSEEHRRNLIGKNSGNTNRLGAILSDETKSKISESKKRVGKWSGEDNPMSGKGDLIKGENNPMYGVIYTWYNNGEKNKRVNQGQNPPLGFVKGKIHKLNICS